MRRAVLFLLVGAAFAASTATAQVRGRMSGFVTDILNRPLGGATVSHASDSTLSDAVTGRWELTVDPAIVNTISASKAGYVKVSTTVVPLAQPTADFALPFAITPKLNPSLVSTLPASISLEARSLMPLSGGPPEGNCMIATDDRTDEGVTMAYMSTDANGVSRWISALPLPAGTAGGAYRVTFEGRNCSTLQTLTDRPSGQYVIDSSPPSIGLVSPYEGRLTIGVVPLPSRDGTTRVLGPVWVIVDAADDVGLTFGSIEVSPSAVHPGCNEHARGATSYRYVCGPFLFLRPGAPYTLTVRVSDLSTKTSEIILNFRTVGGAP